MAKKITGYVKLQIPAGEATPAPPVGPALGQQGVNIMDFCKNFNAKTASQKGLIIPVVITVYADRSYTFITKTPPASILLLKAAGVPKGSGTPNKEKVGKVTKQQVEEIARTKMPDLNAADLAGGDSHRRRDGAADGNRDRLSEYPPSRDGEGQSEIEPRLDRLHDEGGRCPKAVRSFWRPRPRWRPVPILSPRP